ncbi:hypothetical protein [Litchfieldella anticariensis]|nr:hypothetical protein [Halomonas anticariensis]
MPNLIPVAARGSRGMQRVIEFAVAHGWQVSRTSGGHLRLYKPGCGVIFAPFTASDRRAQRNALARLRRAQRQAKATKARQITGRD